MNNLIDVQNCNMFQETYSNGTKSDWLVRKNISGETLCSLPSSVSDKAMFALIDFTKKYELIAFNKGIEFQKGKQNTLLNREITDLKSAYLSLQAHNDYLADSLEKAINKQELN